MTVKDIETVAEPVIESTAPTSAYWIRGIPAALVETFWHYAIPYVKRALDHTSGEFDYTDFRSYCQSRDMQLWLIARPERVVGALTTEIVCYPRKKHLRIVTLAGSEAEQWANVVDAAMVKFAREQACDGIETFVRRGFVKKLDKYGYKLKHCVLHKALGDSP